MVKVNTAPKVMTLSIVYASPFQSKRKFYRTVRSLGVGGQINFTTLLDTLTH